MKQSAALENGQMTWNQLRDQLAGLEAEAEGILTSWQAVKPDFSGGSNRPFSAHAREGCGSRVHKGRAGARVPFIEEKKQAVLRLERRLRELEKRLIQWDAQREGKEDGLKDKEERLRAWIGDRSAEESLGECRSRMTLLKEGAEQARSECRKAEEKAQHATKEAALAEQAERSAQERTKRQACLGEPTGGLTVRYGACRPGSLFNRGRK